MTITEGKAPAIDVTAVVANSAEVKSIDRKPIPRTQNRPSIGLVLGSGAARGFAHIGVLHALKNAGIVPDIIVGTSIGALVGGCYAVGKLDPLEEWARSLTKRRIMSYLDVRIGGSGLISGGRLAAQSCCANARWKTIVSSRWSTASCGSWNRSARRK